MDSLGCRPSGSAWVAPPTDALVLYRDTNSSPSSVQSSESNELPARQPAHSKARKKSGRGSYLREQVPCPKCGSRVQRQYMRKLDKNMHQGGRRRIHVCPYCSADKARTYSTFLDWKNHLSDTHLHCMEAGDSLLREDYAAGFKLDQWGRFYELDGSETNRAYERVRTLRKQYGRYQGQGEGQPPGPPSTIRLPHTKGTKTQKSGRGGRQAARPMTPLHRPPPPSTTPRRSPRLSRPGSTKDFRRLPLSAKSDRRTRRTAHSRSASEDELGRHPSRSSRSSSDHGWSGQGRRSRLREPTPPQLPNFNIDNFTVVSHTTSSFTFTSAHPFFPGWVRVVSAHSTDRVRKLLCSHNAEEELEVKKRVRQDVEPGEVRRFLRQELLKKVVHSWWNKPRLYRHDLAEEREPTPLVRSVVVIPSDPDQPEASPERQEPGPAGPIEEMVLDEPVASPVTSLPRTPGQDKRWACIAWQRPCDR